MTLPNIPDIQPNIKLTKQEVVHLLLSSIAMEEIGLSHILNAEGEKIQQAITARPTLPELIKLNQSLERTLRNTIKSQMMLQYKLEDLIDLVRMSKWNETDEWPASQERPSDEHVEALDECDPNDEFDEEEFDEEEKL